MKNSIVEERNVLAYLCVFLIEDIEHNIGTAKTKEILNDRIARAERYGSIVPLSSSPFESIKTHWSK